MPQKRAAKGSSIGSSKAPSKRPAETNAKKKPATGRSKKHSRADTAASQIYRKQLGAVIMFAAGLLFLALALIEGSFLWKALHDFVLGVFGWCAHLIAPLLIYVSVMITLDKPIGLLKHKIWQTAVLLVLLSGITQVFGMGIPQTDGFVETVKELYGTGGELSSGGVSSLLIGIPLLSLFGKVGAAIIIFLFIFVFIMAITGGTLIGLFRTAVKPVKRLERAYAEFAVQAAEKPAEKTRAPRFNIDVPLDDEKPEKKPEEPPKQIPGAEPQNALRRARDKLLGSSFNPEPRPAPDMPVAPPPPLETMVEPYVEHEQKSPEAVDLSGIINKIVTKDLISTAHVKDQRFEYIDPADIADNTPAVESDAQSRSKAESQYYADRDVGIEEIAPDGTGYYTFPSIDLLNAAEPASTADITEELRDNSERLVNTLKSFGVETRIVDIARGPSVTRYELQPSVGVKISKITGLADDIALSLASAGVRIEAPIPNKAAVGIEVPNKTTAFIPIREIIDSPEFTDSQSRLTVALGKNIEGRITTADIARMPHLLIAGTTGSGKSVCMNAIIISLLFKSSPDEVKFIMIDPKFVEMNIYNGIPHLLVPVVTDAKKAAGALGWAVVEMENRYKLFADNSVRDLKSYNQFMISRGAATMPQIVIFIDELADLMAVAPKDVEGYIGRLTQKARAAGMHLVIATQRPSVDVITGVIKANIPSRIAFSVSSQVDSRTILDIAGAEKLLGRGDMLFNPIGAAKPIRVQGCFVTDSEVERVVNFIKDAQNPNYSQQIIDEIDRQAVAEKGQAAVPDAGGSDEEDSMFGDAVECVVEAGQASTSLLQRRLKLGYSRAARIIDEMESRGIVGPFEGSKPRQVLISRERWLEMRLSAKE